MSPELDELDDSFGVSVGSGVGDSEPPTPPMFTVPVTGFSVVPVDGSDEVDCGSADLVRRGVGDAVALCLGVADGVAFGVGDGLLDTGGGDSWQVGGSAHGLELGLGSGLLLVDADGSPVVAGRAPGPAALAVPGRRRKASGSRASATAARKARRLGADVGTERS